MTKNQAAIRQLFPFGKDSTGNLPSMPGIFPDYPAPIVRNIDGATELALARWGMPSSQFAQMQSAKKRAAKLEEKGKQFDFKELLRMEPDSGTTNIRNLDSKHWKRWLGVESQCLVPFTSFSEFNKAEGGDIWFAFNEERPLAFFAGIWTNWTSVRKVKEGETTNDIFAFVTTEPNSEVGAIHPKAMPVILAVGRKLKQSGVAYGKPNWFWSITYSGTVKPARGNGVATDLEDGKAGFKAAWAELRGRLTDQEIEAWLRRDAAVEQRLR